MTTAEKLRFLADRAEDGKEFKINRLGYRFNNGELEVNTGMWRLSGVLFDTLISRSADLTPKWEFTEDEKVILRNLPDDFQWIARDESDWLYFYTTKPNKASIEWLVGTGYTANLRVLDHLFQCIQWTDTEPCEFRKYL